MKTPLNCINGLRACFEAVVDQSDVSIEVSVALNSDIKLSDFSLLLSPSLGSGKGYLGTEIQIA